MKNFYVGFILLAGMFNPAFSHAVVRCHSLFKVASPYLYHASPSEIEVLFQTYPLFPEKIQQMIEGVNAIPITKQPILDLSGIDAQGSLRTYSNNDAKDPAKLESLDPELKKQIIDSYNHLLNKETFAAYVKELILDSAVLMMKNKDQLTFKIENFSDPMSQKLEEKCTKELFLQNGVIDHQSMAKVLVNRIRSRGDRVAVIPKANISNQTKKMRFSVFYNVPAYGPFFDRVFGAGTAHGQEGHLLQMDYVEAVLINREQFWYYATKKDKGDWVWDTLFDGMNSTFMHPEFYGPYMRKHIPLY